jgi:tRNA (Thr-GGU) A37 N-methylase
MDTRRSYTNKIEFTPIGIVTNRVVEPVDENWGSVISRLTINPEFAKGIMTLDQFSHAVVITFMNQAEFNPTKHLVRRPRGLDAINGTPILDIKPYYPYYDCVKDATVPDWVNRLMQNYF